MAKFIFIVPPFSGHVNPTISLGSMLLQHGHQVAWISVDPMLHKELPKGGEILLIVNEGNNSTDRASHDAATVNEKNITGIESIKFLYEEILIPLNAYMYTGICNWIDLYNPDIIISDQQVFSGAIAAHQKSKIHVTSITTPAAVEMMEEMPGIQQWESDQILKLQTTLGLSERQPLTHTAKANLIFTSRHFFGDKPLADSFKFIGPATQYRPVLASFNYEQLKENDYPKVLISIGTTFDHQYKTDFFSKVCEAFGEKELHVVVISDPDLFKEWPTNFIVQKRIPQLELLPYLDAIVCHGGYNTVCESLANGKPLVVVPIAYDQSYVANRVVNTGCGVRLNYKRFKPQHLSDAVAEILQNNQYKKAAQVVKQSFNKSGGLLGAVKFLTELTKSCRS